jgi:hypothetical protein
MNLDRRWPRHEIYPHFLAGLPCPVFRVSERKFELEVGEEKIIPSYWASQLVLIPVFPLRKIGAKSEISLKGSRILPANRELSHA